MTEDTMPSESSGEQKLYTNLLQLEELETLLEALDESGAERDRPEQPPSLKERLRDLGFSTADDVRRHIAQLHAELDDSE